MLTCFYSRISFARTLLVSAMASAFVAWIATPAPAPAQMAQEQAHEKMELQNMRNEINDIKGNINGGLQEIQNLQNQQNSAGANAQELHLIAKEANVEINSKTSLACYTYNGKVPGPEIRVHEGEVVRVVLHNQLKVPTSLIFQGAALPQTLAGLPRKDAGLVQPGGSFVYQFSAPQQGTYWYHPQVVHSEQKARGMYGLLVVEPRARRSYERDVTVVLSNATASGSGASVPRAKASAAAPAKTPAAAAASDGATNLHTLEPFASGTARTAEFFLFNGKTAPAVPPIDLRKGERIRLRVVNAGSVAIPLALSGHKFEVVSFNGSDALEPHVSRDTITLQPSDRYDLEFTADNPGVWSLASEIPSQASNQGSFPGGIACVVRYSGDNSQ